MVHSTRVDPHWLKFSNRFWYEYETSEGKAWYLVDPVKKSKDLLVEDVMQSDPVTVNPEASIIDALQLMIDKDVTCLPVIVKKELVGIISQKHLLKINKSLMRRLG